MKKFKIQSNKLQWESDGIQLYTFNGYPSNPWTGYGHLGVYGFSLSSFDIDSAPLELRGVKGMTAFTTSGNTCISRGEGMLINFRDHKPYPMVIGSLESSMREKNFHFETTPLIRVIDLYPTMWHMRFESEWNLQPAKFKADKVRICLVVKGWGYVTDLSTQLRTPLKVGDILVFENDEEYSFGTPDVLEFVNWYAN